MNLLTTSLSRLLIAREITLYKQLSKEIGLHLFRSLQSPFFGINLKTAVLKLLVSLPFSKHFKAYLCNGKASMCQNFLINLVLKPSMPGAEEELAPSTALFSSSMLRGASRVVHSSSFNLDSVTTGLLRISLFENIHTERITPFFLKVIKGNVSLSSQNSIKGEGGAPLLNDNDRMEHNREHFAKIY